MKRHPLENFLIDSIRVCLERNTKKKISGETWMKKKLVKFKCYSFGRRKWIVIVRNNFSILRIVFRLFVEQTSQLGWSFAVMILSRRRISRTVCINDFFCELNFQKHGFSDESKEQSWNLKPKKKYCFAFYTLYSSKKSFK